MQNAKAPQRFLLIDLLRGLAALSVLIYHQGSFRNSDCGGLQPLSDYLHIIYNYGNWAVELFWVISGFVFFAVYRSENLTLNGFSFFVRRFSRLYPLHFATLVLVGALQIVSVRLVGHWQIYENNDLYHFVLNLFLASSWGFEKGLSFNGPIWSVSVEEVVYAFFFLFCRFVRIKLPTTVVMLLLSGLGLAVTGSLIFVSASLFYIGGTLFLVWDFVAGVTKYNARLPALLAGVWFVASCVVERVAAHYGAPLIVTKAAYFLSAFPALVFLCASLERIVPARITERFVWIGDITYSTYLIHVPIQILLLLILDYYGVPRPVVDRAWFLLGYVSVVVLLGLLSYRYLERPAQRYLRTWILGHRPARAATTPAASSDVGQPGAC